MRLRGFHLLTIRGIPIIIDYSWFIIFFLVIYMMAEGYFPRTQGRFSTSAYWMMGFVTASLLFVSVLLHELAHSFLAMHYGIEVKSIRLFIFGGIAQVGSEPATGRQEFLIALAGPVASMILGLWFGAVFALSSLTGLLPLIAGISGYLAIANIALALFNLVPGFPLDGGRMLRAFLWDRWNDMARATKVASRLGNGFALLLIALGIVQVIFAQNFLSGLWFVVIGLFMKQAAVGSYQAVVLKQALSGVQIRDIMTENVVGVDWLTSAEDLVRDYIYKHKFTHFPVFDQHEFVGMVSLSQVKSLPRELRVFKQVRDIMTPSERVPSLKPTDDVTEALTRMVSDDLGRMPVVEDGQLVGIVSRSDIMNFFKIKSELGVA